MLTSLKVIIMLSNLKTLKTYIVICPLQNDNTVDAIMSKLLFNRSETFCINLIA